MGGRQHRLGNQDLPVLQCGPSVAVSSSRILTGVCPVRSITITEVRKISILSQLARFKMREQEERLRARANDNTALLRE